MVHGGAVIPHPFGISLFEHTVYYTDWTKMAVMKANKFSDRSPQVLYTTAQNPHGVAVIHQLRQPYGEQHSAHIQKHASTTLSGSSNSLLKPQKAPSADSF